MINIGTLYNFALMFVLIFKTSLLYAQADQPTEDTYNKERDEIYQAIAIPEIPKEAFDQGYLAYQNLKAKGTVTDLPIITFVNFSIRSDHQRLYVVDIKSKKVILTSHVAHGKNSGGHSSAATSFSNRDNSNQSSLGFYLTGETYSGKHGSSLRLDGLSGNLNSEARNRSIVIHAADYVRDGGRSFGCLALPPDINMKAISLLKNHTLIYTFTSSDYAKLGDKNTAITASADKNYSSVPDTTSVTAEFPTFESIKKVSGAKAAIGLGGASAAGVVILNGSKKYEQCQNLSNQPWSETVKGINQGNNPSSYFTGSWAELHQEVKDKEVDNEDAVKLSQNRLSEINDCVAVAHVSERTDFKKEDINKPESKSSADGKIKCTYNGPESQDYNSCLEAINTYEALGIKEKEIHAEQATDLKNTSAQKLSKVNGVNAQETSLTYSKESQEKLADITTQRAEISNDKLNMLSAIASKIPTTDSLFDECQAKFQKHGVVSKDEFTAFVKMYSTRPVEVEDKTNHCANAVSSEVNPIHNEVARAQIKTVLKQFGKEVVDYNSKSLAFLNRDKPSLGSGSGSGINITNSNNDFLNVNLNSSNNDSNSDSSDMNNQEVLGFNNFNNKNGSNNNNNTSYNSLLLSKTNSKDKNSFPALLPFNNSYATSGSSQASFGRDAKNLNGVYDEKFYEKITMALKNPELLDSLKLSDEQMKEYLARKSYLDSFNSHQARIPASERASNNIETISFHSKDMNLFEIISVKYREIYKTK